MNTCTKRPYELTGQHYALWYDARALGIATHSAIGHYLCGGGVKIQTPHGQSLDARSREVLKELARKRGILIPESAF